MENDILKIAASQGVWTLLSFLLILFILRNQERLDNRQNEREERYQNVIISLTNQLNITQEIKDDIKEIKTIIHKK